MAKAAVGGRNLSLIDGESRYSFTSQATISPNPVSIAFIRRVGGDNDDSDNWVVIGSYVEQLVSMKLSGSDLSSKVDGVILENIREFIVGKVILSAGDYIINVVSVLAKEDFDNLCLDSSMGATRRICGIKSNLTQAYWKLQDIIGILAMLIITFIVIAIVITVLIATEIRFSSR